MSAVKSESFFCSRCDAAIKRWIAENGEPRLGSPSPLIRFVRPSTPSSFIHHIRLRGLAVTLCGLPVEHDRLSKNRRRGLS